MKLDEYVKQMEKEHPNPECPKRKFAALHYVGEPQFSVTNGKIKSDDCICHKEKDTK
jgi:hypothetical protein